MAMMNKYNIVGDLICPFGGWSLDFFEPLDALEKECKTKDASEDKSDG